MSTRNRIYYPGAIYHIYTRGNNKKNIFHDDLDKKLMYRLLEKFSGKYNVNLYAFCLMSNHIHLLVEVSDVGIDKFMHSVCQRHSALFNKKYNQVGHLFQSRYNAILVDSENYFLKLVQYIHQNPVKAKLVSDAEQYYWSSHNIYLGKAQLKWVHTNVVLQHFSSLREYKEFINNHSNEDEQNFLTGIGGSGVLASQQKIKTLLGNDAYVRYFAKISNIEKYVLKRLQMSNFEGCTNKEKIKAITIISYICCSLKVVNISSVAQAYGVTHSCVYKNITAMRKDLSSDLRSFPSEFVKYFCKNP
ncbi:MAG: transposase [Gammaproteobacteria bacterium]|nr:transposase [Gammaproteobacteria bacterium]